MITKEQIEARLAKLKQDREQLIANLNAISGAIQDCEYWLTVETTTTETATTDYADYADDTDR